MSDAGKHGDAIEIAKLRAERDTAVRALEAVKRRAVASLEYICGITWAKVNPEEAFKVAQREAAMCLALIRAAAPAPPASPASPSDRAPGQVHEFRGRALLPDPPQGTASLFIAGKHPTCPACESLVLPDGKCVGGCGHVMAEAKTKKGLAMLPGAQCTLVIHDESHPHEFDRDDSYRWHHPEQQGSRFPFGKRCPFVAPQEGEPK